jgi:hypothetical protein
VVYQQRENGYDPGQDLTGKVPPENLRFLKSPGYSIRYTYRYTSPTSTTNGPLPTPPIDMTTDFPYYPLSAEESRSSAEADRNIKTIDSF